MHAGDFKRVDIAENDAFAQSLTLSGCWSTGSILSDVLLLADDEAFGAFLRGDLSTAGGVL